MVKLARNLPMIVAVAGVFFLAVSAQAQKAGSLVDRFERTYRSSRTLQARFLERYLENGKEVRSVLKLQRTPLSQSQKGLVYKRGAFESVTGVLSLKVVVR